MERTRITRTEEEAVVVTTVTIIRIRINIIVAEAKHVADRRQQSYDPS